MISPKYYKNIEDFIVENNKDSRYLILITENTNLDIDKLEDFKISGAIFPEIILNNSHYKEGLLASVIDDNFNVDLIKDMKTFESNEKTFQDKESLIVLFDALSSDISLFLDNLFESVSEQTKIIGGGSGKMTLKQEPVIFHDGTLHQNAAIVLSTNAKLHIGIENAWEKLEGPFVVTSSEKNVLKTLNFSSSFEVYKDFVEKDSGKKITKDNFFTISKSYPLGIIKFDKEVIVRDPIAIDKDNNIVIVGDIPQNSTINILKGNKQNLIDSGNKAILKLNKDLDSHKNILIFDCISRSFFIDEELKEITKELKQGSILFGVLSLGEIANTSDEYLSFYNRTCVLGMLC